MKKIMFVGRQSAGKTTLTQRLNNEEIRYRKTQDNKQCGFVLDTPGEYLENRSYYKALMVSSMDCEIIGLIQASNDVEEKFPPGFASMFQIPVIGIITKMDLEDRDTEAVGNLLERAGCSRILEISAVENAGIDDLKDILKNDD